MKKIFEKILVDDKEYEVIIEKKKIKNCYFRFYNGQFHASCPYFYPKKLLLNSLKLYAKKLIKEPRIKQAHCRILQIIICRHDTCA